MRTKGDFRFGDTLIEKNKQGHHHYYGSETRFFEDYEITRMQQEYNDSRGH